MYPVLGNQKLPNSPPGGGGSARGLFFSLFKYLSPTWVLGLQPNTLSVCVILANNLIVDTTEFYAENKQTTTKTTAPELLYALTAEVRSLGNHFSLQNMLLLPGRVAHLSSYSYVGDDTQSK